MTSDEEQTAEPEVELIFLRDGVPLAPQKVNVVYLTTGGRPFASSRTLVDDAAVESNTSVRVSRPIVDGFDVEVGDRFSFNGQGGEVKDVSQVKGLIWASLSYDTGSA